MSAAFAFFLGLLVGGLVMTFLNEPLQMLLHEAAERRHNNRMAQLRRERQWEEEKARGDVP